MFSRRGGLSYRGQWKGGSWELYFLVLAFSNKDKVLVGGVRGDLPSKICRVRVPRDRKGGEGLSTRWKIRTGAKRKRAPWEKSSQTRSRGVSEPAHPLKGGGRRPAGRLHPKREKVLSEIKSASFVSRGRICGKRERLWKHR